MSPKNRLHRHTISFYHAFSGLIYTISSQPNMMVHLTVALCVVISGMLLDISRLEWIIITFTICLVLMAEMINTAVESMVDLITQEHRQQAKIAKDVASGMVLVSAITSVIVGLVIFIPYLE